MINLWPVVLGGLIAVISSVVTVLLTQHKEFERDRRRDERRLRNQKRDRLANQYFSLIQAGWAAKEATKPLYGTSGRSSEDLDKSRIQLLDEVFADYVRVVAQLTLESETEHVIALFDKLFKQFVSYRALFEIPRDHISGTEQIKLHEALEEARDAVDKTFDELKNAAREQLSDLDKTL